MKSLEELKKQLRPGQVYRRYYLEQWSKTIDKHLKQLVEEGTLKKLSQGLYYYPIKTSFGNIPPEDEKLVSAFLKSNDFLLTTLNKYNSLGVGTTQLYNKKIVYNHKRHGQFRLGGKLFDFRLKHKFPKQLSKEFLLVDLLNNINELAEDTNKILQNVKTKMLRSPKSKMKRIFNTYAGKITKRKFNQWIAK